MSNNGNGNGNNNNGYHCPRCTNGIIFMEGRDLYCLQCGWRLSFFYRTTLVTNYLLEAIVARLIRNGNRAMHDIKSEHCELAGLTA